MTRERMLKLLKDQETDLKEMLADVLYFEQEFISYGRIPQRIEKIDEIITSAAKAKLGTSKSKN